MTWFLVIVFFHAQGGAYLDRDLLPLASTSQQSCARVAQELVELYGAAKREDASMDDARVFCVKQNNMIGVSNWMNEKFDFGGQPA